MPDMLAGFLSAGGEATLWTLVALAAATFVSEDLACVTAGLLIGQGSVPFAAGAAACFAGIFIGDILLVVLGRTLGRAALDRAPLRWWVSRASVERAERWIARQGPRLAFASRFVPGTRLPTYVAVGVLRAPLPQFIGWFALACAVWTPLLVGIAAALGAAAGHLFETWRWLAPMLLLAGLLAWMSVRLALAASTWRGRRLLLARWRRLTRWEFWPMWVLYPPVGAYIAWLALRHRSLALVSVVNPGMDGASGLCGESKSGILAALAAAGTRIARWHLIAPGQPAARLDALRGFMEREKLTFPIVIKPDVGERGNGVVIARDEQQAARVLATAPAAQIAQAYVPGVEFGIFYHRSPADTRGSILAITDKRLISVTGDGTRPLETLILADDRAVCMAPFFLEKFADRLDEIPAPGEVVSLTELGTHCRGALFLDGTHLATGQLVDAVEQVSRQFVGFHFGRYDVRTGSAEALQRGEFTVIELNGLSSEATSIYDPRHSVWFGWRTLARQWRIAFRIAAENRARGARPLRLGEVWQLVVSHKESA